MVSFLASLSGKSLRRISLTSASYKLPLYPFSQILQYEGCKLLWGRISICHGQSAVQDLILELSELIHKSLIVIEMSYFLLL